MSSGPKETELYPHVKLWLEQRGYTVHGEVKGCDIAAVKGEELLLVELKRAVNLQLIHQIVKRQTAGAPVYGAVPPPKDFAAKHWRNSIRLLKRLDAGLLVVHHDEARVEAYLHPAAVAASAPPGPPALPGGKNLVRAYHNELRGRTLDANLGGSPGWNHMDSRKEKALCIAVALERLGPSTRQTLSLAGASSLTAGILRNNRDGWFMRIDTERYDLTAEGRAALTQYRRLADKLRARADAIVRNCGLDAAGD